MKIGVQHVVLFVVAFLVGCCVIYYSPMEYKTVLVYPTPSNVDQIQYKDHTGTCFQFAAEEVKCTGAENKIPIQ
jgi:hypothetical protein